MATFNDDIESTAAAVLASMYGAAQLRNVPPLRKQHFLFCGRGAGQHWVGAHADARAGQGGPVAGGREEPYVALGLQGASTFFICHLLRLLKQHR